MRQGTEIKTILDIAKITRPLLSVNQMTENGLLVVCGKHKSYIQLAGTRHRIQLKAQGKLYMLDMRVKVPLGVTKNSPCVRQVSEA